MVTWEKQQGWTEVGVPAQGFYSSLKSPAGLSWRDNHSTHCVPSAVLRLNINYFNPMTQSQSPYNGL